MPPSRRYPGARDYSTEGPLSPVVFYNDRVTDELAGLVASGPDRERLERLLSKGWSLPPAEHPLRRPHGARLGLLSLLVLLGPKNMVGSRYYQLFLLDASGRLSEGPLALGLYNTGPYPGFNWIELTRYDAAPRFDGEPCDLVEQGLDRELFRLLSGLVPSGGHIMVEYESPGQRESERILTLGYPPASSPIGYLLLFAGCRSFRDWYISEGGREGPRKLQGFKPLDEAIARGKSEALRGQLSQFLATLERPEHGEYDALARRLAWAVLAELERER